MDIKDNGALTELGNFQGLNDAIVALNLCKRNAAAFPKCVLANGDLWSDRVIYWRGKAWEYADILGTRIVTMPNNPDIETAELFLKIAGEQD